MSLHILVVDDEAGIRQLVGTYLREEGYVVDEAVDGAREQIRTVEVAERTWLIHMPIVNSVVFETDEGLVVVDTGDGSHGLADPASFAGYQGDPSAPSAVPRSDRSSAGPWCSQLRAPVTC